MLPLVIKVLEFVYFMEQYLISNLLSSILNCLKAEGALNHDEITVKQNTDFLPYKFDLINSLLKIWKIWPYWHFNFSILKLWEKIVPFKTFQSQLVLVWIISQKLYWEFYWNVKFRSLTRLKWKMNTAIEN